MDLTNITKEELEKELARRAKTHKFTVKGVDFEFTLEEIKLLQKELNKVNPPPNPQEDFLKAIERSKRENDKAIPYIPAPQNPQPWIPEFPKRPNYNEIWCEVKNDIVPKILTDVRENVIPKFIGSLESKWGNRK